MMRLHLPWRTVRGRLLMAALLVEMVMLALLVGNSLRLLHDAMGEQAREQANQIAPVLSAALVAPLAQYDYATVQAVIDESHAIHGIEYLAVTDASGEVVATSGWPSGKPLPPVTGNFNLDGDNNPPRYDMALPIRQSGQTLGQLQFGLDLTRILVARKKLVTQGVLIALSELLLSAGLLTLLGLLITRQLSVLTTASLRVAQGQLTMEPVPEGQDDVGRLGAAFNVMSRAIAERVEQLTRANQETAELATSLQERNRELALSHTQLSAENAIRLKTQQELEEALQRIGDRNEQLNAIFELSPDGFVAFDSQLRVKYANPAFHRLTGLSPQEVVGLDEALFSQNLAEACLPKARFPGLAALREPAPRGHPVGQASLPAPATRHQIELGSPVHRVVQVALRESAAESVSQILYLRDVTHETEVDRMKSEFLSHAAHELRTPMVSIYGYTELMLHMPFKEEKRKEVLGIIYRQSELMIAIINELLDLVRIEERRGQDFEFEAIDANELTRQVVIDFGVPAGRQSPLMPTDTRPLWVRADRKKLMQAVRNIVSNAYKYSPDGGEVSVSLLQGQSDQEGRLGIRVRDQGLGMTPEQVSRVFERFYRADNSGQIPGTGLGMSLVKEIIELHGGTVELHSEAGQGTEVTLWVPTTPAPPMLLESDGA